jgi:glycosyltransferase involved in cell wall biosynthesis
MNVLMIVPYMPTLVRTRPYNLLRALVASGAKVTLATLWEDESEKRQIAEWEAAGVRVIAAELSRARKLQNLGLAVPTRLPLQARYCWQPELARKIGVEIERCAYQVVHVEHLRGAEYGRYARARFETRGVSVPVVWDSVDCISLLFEQASKTSKSLFGRWATRLDLGRTRRYEGKLVKHFDQTLVTSAMDKAALERLAGGGIPEEQVRILRNGVDLDYFRPDGKTRDKDLVIFSGKMSYHANIHAAFELVTKIMPIVWLQRPQIRVQLAGKDPPVALTNLANEDKRVDVTGTVPHLPDYLGKAALAVAPVEYGAGIQNKVLEAMACATPVVTSPQGASALETVAGRDLEIAKSPEEFARIMIGLLDNAERSAALGARGRAYVEGHHDWKKIGKELITIYAGKQASSRK